MTPAVLERPTMTTNYPDIAPGTHTPVRPTLEQMHLPLGKKTRLHRMLHQHGPGNGTLLFLPIDQGLEHGPMDFFVNPPCGDPHYQCQLAAKGNYSAVVFHVGIAEKYMPYYAGHVPLVLKINGKTCVPNDDAAFSPLTSMVEDAVRLGADAIGYTLYVGSPSQAEDIRQFNEVRRECEVLGMPIIMWAYPRGEFINEKGGKDSLYAIDYAARVASELGADIVKINYPKVETSTKANTPKPYNDLQWEEAEAVRQVVRSAGSQTMVVFSGGSKVDDAEMMNMVRLGMDNGGTGLIYGRNMWQRPMNEALDTTQKVTAVMREY